jgi:hypothetical protein
MSTINFRNIQGGVRQCEGRTPIEPVRGFLAGLGEDDIS